MEWAWEKRKEHKHLRIATNRKKKWIQHTVFRKTSNIRVSRTAGFTIRWRIMLFCDTEYVSWIPRYWGIAKILEFVYIFYLYTIHIPLGVLAQVHPIFLCPHYYPPGTKAIELPLDGLLFLRCWKRLQTKNHRLDSTLPRWKGAV